MRSGSKRASALTEGSDGVAQIRSNLLFLLAGGLGFEPRLAESESAVLPLDDPPR